MLKNAYLLAKIGADTAEKERHFAEIENPGGAAVDEPSREEASARSGGAKGVAGGPVGGRITSLERTEMIGKIAKSLQMFCGLVLGCTETKFCKKVCILKHLSNSTIFAHFCTAPPTKF